MGRVAFLVSVLAVARIAAAQPAPAPTPTKQTPSARLFFEGRALAERGDYAAACERFQASLALERAPGTALNYGACLEQLGRRAHAWRMYDEAARAFARDHDKRATYAQARADAVVPRLATMIVRIAAPTLPGLVVEIGGRSVPVTAEIRELVDVGDVTVTASAPGARPFTSTQTVAAGAELTVDVPTLRAPETSGPPAEARGPRSRGRTRLALGVGSVGAASVGVSLGLGLVARSAYRSAVADHCDDTGPRLVCSEQGASQVAAATTKANVATVLAIGGLALVGGGVALYLTAPRARIVVTPIATDQTLGLAASGRF